MVNLKKLIVVAISGLALINHGYAQTPLTVTDMLFNSYNTCGSFYYIASFHARDAGADPKYITELKNAGDFHKTMAAGIKSWDAVDSTFEDLFEKLYEELHLDEELFFSTFGKFCTELKDDQAGMIKKFKQMLSQQ